MFENLFKKNKTPPASPTPPPKPQQPAPQQSPQQPIGFTKQKRFLFFKISKSKPIYADASTGITPPSAKATPPPPPPPMKTTPPAPPPKMKPAPTPPPPKTVTQPPPQPRSFFQPQPAPRPQTATPPPQPSRPFIFKPAPQKTEQKPAEQRSTIPGVKRSSAFQNFINNTAFRQKGLEAAMREQGIKDTPYNFVRRMFFFAVLTSVAITVAVGVIVVNYGLSPILAILTGIAAFFALFNKFVRYPMDKGKNTGKLIERDIIFATRDIVIGMRSGMPLFNAITLVSTGYGAASSEFAKIVERVQLGEPIEQAMDEVSSASDSRTFKRIMLQASVSIKSGADIISALEGVIDEVTQERVIELRRYGQRLNALAMFYMLFGVIFPSMGIAVAAILTTFISIITIDVSTLVFALVFIFFLQIMFLNIMRGSRPTFSM